MTAPVTNPMLVVSQGLHMICQVEPNAAYASEIASPSPAPTPEKITAFLIRLLICIYYRQSYGVEFTRYLIASFRMAISVDSISSASARNSACGNIWLIVVGRASETTVWFASV